METRFRPVDPPRVRGVITRYAVGSELLAAFREERSSGASVRDGRLSGIAATGERRR
jgi:hypothetical protein